MANSTSKSKWKKKMYQRLRGSICFRVIVTVNITIVATTAHSHVQWPSESWLTNENVSLDLISHGTYINIMHLWNIYKHVFHKKTHTVPSVFVKRIPSMPPNVTMISHNISSIALDFWFFSISLLLAQLPLSTPSLLRWLSYFFFESDYFSLGYSGSEPLMSTI